MARVKPSVLKAEFDKLVVFVNTKMGQVAEAIRELRDVLSNHGEQTDAHLAEFGDQLWGIHVLQEVICREMTERFYAGRPADYLFEKAKAERDARRAAIDEQQRLLRERAAEDREAPPAGATRGDHCDAGDG